MRETPRVDPLAGWGAVTGTGGLLIAARREFLANRKRLTLAPGVNLTTSRVEPAGEVLLGWACVAFWNTGGRPLAVERAGFQFSVHDEASGETKVIRAMIHIGTPIEAAVDGPTRKIYTPLGPMLAAGISPFDLVQAVAVTAGGREWLSPPNPLIQSIPPIVSPELLAKGLERLRDLAESPPRLGSEIGLLPEEPYLIDAPPGEEAPPLGEQTSPPDEADRPSDE
jgi:hypothetical protein